MRDPEHVTWAITGTASTKKTSQDFARAVGVFQRREWVRIWYDSGHTISNGAVFEVRHRNVPFTDFSWVDFGGYDITKEKPSALDLKTIGEEDSLFCWVKNEWPLPTLGAAQGGWLACDNGSMEIADFILSMRKVIRLNSP